MSLDTKYRPTEFEDVLGQDDTIEVLRKLLRNGQVYQKSYVFAGPSGTGKTTTARILARAMLCDNISDNGDPCNDCESCQEILEKGHSHSFREMDAANHSGKDHIQKILKDMKYYNLDGNDRRIYLIDECHRLSKSAMDALLKPMEDNIPGTEDKRLVCLFCTTEPEKLRTTIKTRCMMFPIREPDKDNVVDRLSYICEEEDFPYTEEGLGIIYQEGNGHIRDMINAVEKIGRIDSIDVESVRKRLGLSARSNYYDILSHLGEDIERAIEKLNETTSLADPESIYTGLAEAAMASYRLSKGVKVSIPQGDKRKAEKVYELHGEALLLLTDRILDSQKRITEDVLQCEVFFLHNLLQNGSATPDVSMKVENQSVDKSSSPESETSQEGISEDKSEEDDSESEETDEEMEEYAASISSYGSNLVNQDKQDDNLTSSDSNVTKDEDSSPVSSPEPAEEDDLKSLFEESF
jgi:DNA polymerase III subunit gamma/tau